MNIKIYNNLIWEILDQGSKLFILTLLIENEFQGECKLISKITDETTVLEVIDEFNHSLVLPINILDILND